MFDIVDTVPISLRNFISLTQTSDFLSHPGVLSSSSWQLRFLSQIMQDLVFRMWFGFTCLNLQLNSSWALLLSSIAAMSVGWLSLNQPRRLRSNFERTSLEETCTASCRARYVKSSCLSSRCFRTISRKLLVISGSHSKLRLMKFPLLSCCFDRLRGTRRNWSFTCRGSRSESTVSFAIPAYWADLSEE